MKLMFFFITSLLLAFIDSASAKADLDAFFTRYATRFFPFRNDDNGCKDHADELRSSYVEASKLIDAAVAAIATVKQSPRPAFLKRKDRWNWDRQAQAMFSMFGVKISSKGGPEPESKADFTYVEDIFRQMKYGMDHDETEDRRPAALYCNTGGWKYYANDAADPFYPDRAISDRKDEKGKDKFPRGCWCFNYNYVMFDDSTPTEHGMCKPDVLAETVAPSNFITWCNFGFATLALSIQLDGIKEYDRLGDPARKSMSHTWVHELAHFYGSYRGRLPDQTAVDVDGKAIVKDGVEVKTYGVPSVLNLAKNRPADAARTADAYGWFAVAMYLPEWNWSQGFAHGFFPF